MSSKGWIKLHRKLRENSLYKDCNSKQRDILINLLLMANHKSNKWIFKGEEFEVKSGQLVTSLESIVNSCAKDVTVQNVRTALLKFEKYGFLINKSTNKNRLITIVNWELYQSEDEKQQVNQQADNNQSTTNKNVKNVRNKKIYVETSDEYRLAKFLFKHIKINNYNAKEPNYQAWSQQFDYIIRIDGREIEEVEQVIKWCQSDRFWCANILSPKKLRSKYDQLVIRMNQDRNKKVNVYSSNLDGFEVI